MFADSPIKTWLSKLKSPYTPEVGGAQARIASLVKLSERPSGFQDKLQPVVSFSVLAAVGFTIGPLTIAIPSKNRHNATQAVF